MYYLTWSLDREQYTIDASIWNPIKGIIALLEVLEIPYSIRFEPIPEYLPGEITQ